MGQPNSRVCPGFTVTSLKAPHISAEGEGTATVSADDMKKQLAEKDAIIAKQQDMLERLQRRLNELERQSSSQLSLPPMMPRPPFGIRAPATKLAGGAVGHTAPAAQDPHATPCKPHDVDGDTVGATSDTVTTGGSTQRPSIVLIGSLSDDEPSSPPSTPTYCALGFQPSGGFDVTQMPQSWRKLCEEAGLRLSDLQNAQTAALVYHHLCAELTVLRATVTDGGMDDEAMALYFQQRAASLRKVCGAVLSAFETCDEHAPQKLQGGARPATNALMHTFPDWSQKEQFSDLDRFPAVARSHVRQVLQACAEAARRRPH